LPSQEGFGTDLMAQNVIVPVIDLTAAAQGTSTPEILQTALAFGSQTAFSAAGSTAVIANTTGFWRIFGVSTQLNSSGVAVESRFDLTDGLSTKIVWAQSSPANINGYTSQDFDFVVFLAAGESVSATTTASGSIMKGSARQIADVNGNLVNPSGFSPQ